eukprot:gene37-biopygen326
MEGADSQGDGVLLRCTVECLTTFGWCEIGRSVTGAHDGMSSRISRQGCSSSRQQPTVAGAQGGASPQFSGSVGSSSGCSAGEIVCSLEFWRISCSGSVIKRFFSRREHSSFVRAPLKMSLSKMLAPMRGHTGLGRTLSRGISTSVARRNAAGTDVIGIDLGTTNSCVAVMEGSAARAPKNTTFAAEPSMTATQLLVVPRSMPITSAPAAFRRKNQRGADVIGTRA